ncbi:non-heme chloroperoxidase [Kitasatospora sp. GP30]|uniref:alpha/beta fold hydrolase n=1 Tax=Kitasatospora sp. GP30 TaxID=3035084 RepID=UPI000C712EDA|nr:alpha/beta hydrolase [Kitasatospora sp. GP30]MDH6141991.1 non-heme chloroperoxidase [Kitasatospora sp. GP30]
MPTIRTPDGTQLFYRDWGTGRPVVFVHSMLMSSQMWQHQMQHLVEHGHRAIAYDRRGHGRSDDPGTGYEFDTLADDLAALLAELDLTDVTLVGHSMGGGEVVRYLSRHGDQRISRIALVGSTLPHLDVEPTVAAALLDRLRVGYGQWVAENAALAFGDGLPDCSIPQVEKDRTIQDWMAVSLKAAVDCTAVNLVADFRADLRAIRVPTLVVHGDSDAFAPLEICGRRSADLIPGSRLVVYRNASHMLHLSHRRQLNADLLAFVQHEGPMG